jgi:hypothetical protein
MLAELREKVDNALAVLPTPQEVRRRIADNLAERQLLRRVLNIIEQGRMVSPRLTRNGGRDA